MLNETKLHYFKRTYDALSDLSHYSDPDIMKFSFDLDIEIFKDYYRDCYHLRKDFYVTYDDFIFDNTLSDEYFHDVIIESFAEVKNYVRLHRFFVKPNKIEYWYMINLTGEEVKQLMSFYKGEIRKEKIKMLYK